MNRAYEKGRRANEFAQRARDRAVSDLQYLIDLQKDAHHFGRYPFRGVKCSNPKCKICKP